MVFSKKMHIFAIQNIPKGAMNIIHQIKERTRT